MLKNFLKVAVRNLSRNKVYVAINIVGLGLALACCIVAYLNFKYNWDFDTNHEQINHIYKVHCMHERQGDLHEFGRIPMPMADAMREDLSGVDKVFRFERHVFTVRDESMADKVFNTAVCYAEPGFLESFTFPLVSGNLSAYHEIDRAVVTKDYAEKFYGDEDPIGKILTVFDDTGMSFNFVIAGVVERAPQNSSVHFELLTNFENRFRMYDDNVRNNWASFAQNTFVYFNDPAKATAFESQLEQYLPLQQQANEGFQLTRFLLSPMNTHAHNSREIWADNLSNAMDPAAVLTPQIMALLILLVACFNFTNTAIANSNRRLKEIGVRKVLGGSRKQLINQFMTENMTVCLLALIISVGIATYLVPAYAAMWEGMELKLELTDDIGFYLFLFGLLVFTTLLAGLYPSLYISKYQPVSILRGGLSIGSKGGLTKFLLATQYTFTVIAIFASVAFIQNARYQDTLDMGYDRDQVIAVNLLNETQYQKMKASMMSNPNITSFASAKHHIGQGNYGATLINEGEEVNSNMMDVGVDYLETMGLEILQGRSYSKDLEASDTRSSIIVNEKLVKSFGWENPIGQRLALNDTTTLTVVGVVKDFYMNGFWAPIQPTGFRLSSLKFEDDGTYSFIACKTDIDHITEVYDYLEAEWNGKIPNKVFSGFYQNDLLRKAKTVNNNIMTIFTFLGVVAFILSCLGLFTLVSINLIRKTKEIGVRKVLGGEVGHIVYLISKGYFLLLFISSVIGVTAGYYLINALISDIFTNHKEMDAFTFAIPMVTIIGVSLAIASLRTLKAAVVNPVKSLRYE